MYSHVSLEQGDNWTLKKPNLCLSVIVMALDIYWTSSSTFVGLLISTLYTASEHLLHRW